MSATNVGRADARAREAAARGGEPLLHVDLTRCDGRGLCAELVPQLIALDDWGYPLVLTGGRDAIVPPDSEGDARDAVALCPRQALSLRRPRGGR